MLTENKDFLIKGNQSLLALNASIEDAKSLANKHTAILTLDENIKLFDSTLNEYENLLISTETNYNISAEKRDSLTLSLASFIQKRRE